MSLIGDLVESRLGWDRLVIQVGACLSELGQTRRAEDVVAVYVSRLFADYCENQMWCSSVEARGQASEVNGRMSNTANLCGDKLRTADLARHVLAGIQGSQSHHRWLMIVQSLSACESLT